MTTPPPGPAQEGGTLAWTSEPASVAGEYHTRTSKGRPSCDEWMDVGFDPRPYQRSLYPVPSSESVALAVLAMEMADRWIGRQTATLGGGECLSELGRALAALRGESTP